MAASAATMQITRDLFLQQPLNGSAPPLELFVKVREPNEHHFYCKHVSFLDFALTFGPEVRALDCIVTRMPPALLNPNYWEPLTRENETAVREKMSGIVTRPDAGRTLLWRSDAVSKTRLLRDGLDVPAELVNGNAFRVSGEGVLKLGRAWSGGADRFEWVGFAALPPGDAAVQAAQAAHADVAAMRLGHPEARLVFTSQDDRGVRAVFSQRAWLRRAVAAAVRGFVTNLSRQPNAYINERVGEQLVRLCDGLGFSADPSRDFTDKVRTHEVTAHVGRTEWGVQVKPGQDALTGEEKILIYYDRVSGIWAVAS